MANVTLLGAIYVDVPAVDLPQTGGGTVRFYEAIEGDSISYGSAPLVGTASVGMDALCEEEQ